MLPLLLPVPLLLVMHMVVALFPPTRGVQLSSRQQQHQQPQQQGVPLSLGWCSLPTSTPNHSSRVQLLLQVVLLLLLVPTPHLMWRPQ